jgi:hypothetical protein
MLGEIKIWKVTFKSNVDESGKENGGWDIDFFAVHKQIDNEPISYIYFPP